MYKRVGLNLELLFLAIGNQDMLIKLLLDAGGDLDHEDKFGDPAFITAARFDWFDIHEQEMTEIYEHPNEMGYDSEIFSDKRTQFAVRSKWIASGQRTRALQDLMSWIAFLTLLTLVAVRYSGRDSYDAYSMHAGISDRVLGDEWDEVDLKVLSDVGNLEDWHSYLNGPLLDMFWQDESFFFNDSVGETATAQATTRGALVNGLLALLGRPRYRQLRTRSDSCLSANPSLVAQTEETCFEGAVRGIYGRPSADIEDRESFLCPRDGREDLKIDWGNYTAFPIMGTYGFYRGGGFSVNLPSNRTEAARLLSDLEACSWVSLNTRVAMIEFSLYSRTLEMFSHGSIFLETTAVGGIVAGFRMETRKLVSYNSHQDYVDIIPEILWIIMVATYFFNEFMAMRESWGAEHIAKKNTPMWWWFTLRDTDEATRELLENPKEFRTLMALPRYICFDRSLCIYKTKRNIPPYWVNVFNYVDIVIMFLITALLTLHGVLCYAANSRLADWYTLSVSEEYVDISDLMWLAMMRQHILAIVVLLCYVKSLEYLQVTAALAIPVIIIGGMLYQLLSFFLIFAVFILAFGLFDYVLYGLSFESSSTVIRSIVSTFRGALGDLDFDGKNGLDRSFAIFMTCLSAFLLVILLLNLLIAVMNEAFDEIKDSAEARWCYMQFRMIVRHALKTDSLSKLSSDLHKIKHAPAAKLLKHRQSFGMVNAQSPVAQAAREAAGEAASEKLRRADSASTVASQNYRRASDVAGEVLLPQLGARNFSATNGADFAEWLGARAEHRPHRTATVAPAPRRRGPGEHWQVLPD